MSPQKAKNTFHNLINTQMRMPQLESPESAPASPQGLSRWKCRPDTTEQGGKGQQTLQFPLVSPSRAEWDQHHHHHVPH